MRSTTIKRPRQGKTSGLTLVEFLFGVAIGSVALGVTAAFTIGAARSFASAYNYVEMETQSRAALDLMSHQIRRTDILTGFSTNSLTFQDHDAKTLSFTYSPSDRTLTRSKNGETTTLLTGCDSLAFSIYQRNTTNGTYDQYPTTLEASNCKVVQVTWVCSREVLGHKLNTELVQTAKIVIRNQ